MIGDQEEKGESSRRKRESRAGGKGRVEQEEKGESTYGIIGVWRCLGATLTR